MASYGAHTLEPRAAIRHWVDTTQTSTRTEECFLAAVQAAFNCNTLQDTSLRYISAIKYRFLLTRNECGLKFPKKM